MSRTAIILILNLISVYYSKGTYTPQNLLLRLMRKETLLIRIEKHKPTLPQTQNLLQTVRQWEPEASPIVRGSPQGLEMWSKWKASTKMAQFHNRKWRAPPNPAK